MEAETSFSRASSRRLQEEEEEAEGEDCEEEEEPSKAYSSSLAYDFFARCPDVEDEETEREEPNAAEEEEEEEGVEELLKGMLEGRAVEYAGAIYRPFRQQMALEEQAYFYPPTTPVSVESKVGVAQGRRDLAEEGLYVGEVPEGVSVSTRNRMEHRLLRGGETRWFGEDGEIPRPSPLLAQPPRPYALEEEGEVGVRYVPASLLLSPLTHTNAPASGGGRPAEREVVVGVAGVRLIHHHLFGRQHVLASRLTQLDSQYRKLRRSEHRAKLIRKKLELVREGVLGARTGPRVDMYRREMQQLRAKLSEEERLERTVLKQLLKSWLELKTLRQSQGYNCVPHQLFISKRTVEPEEDGERWSKEIDAEVEEAREMARHEGSEFDEEETRKRVERNAKANRRNIGEPEVYVELKHSVPIAPFDQCPRLEQKRRNDMRRCEMFIKVYCNDKLVTQTASKRLSEEFSVSFGEEFRLKVAQEECKLCFKIYERMANALTAPHLMAEVYVNPTDENQMAEEDGEEEGRRSVQFADHRLVKWDHEAVGSGSDLLTTGSLHCSVNWSGEREGEERRRGPRHRLPLPGGGGGGGLGWDTEKAKRWTEESQLDPNDPENALFFHHLQSGLLRDGQNEYFRLDNLQRPFDFVQSEREEEEFRNNPRFRLIRLRDTQVKEFAALRMIPMNAAEVDPSFFQLYERRVVEERRLQGSVGDDAADGEDEEESEGDPDLRRSKVVRYLSKVREAVWWKYQLAHRKRKSLSEVVMEDDIPNIGALGSSIYRGLTENRRPLKPTRKDRRKVTYAHNVTGNNVILLVNVANAFNVPVRKETTRNNRLGVYGRSTAASTSSAAAAPVAMECLVRPVVEVSFQQQSVSTGSSWGPNPCWNEDLQLEFRAPHHDLSPANLQKVRDNVFFNLFDEVSIDMLEDDRDRKSHVHQRVERRWLGSFVLPFSTLYLNGRVEGTFRMDTPSVLMGYTSGEVKEEEVYITLFLTLEPTLPLPLPFHGQVESRESEKVVERIEGMAKDFRSAFPKREFKMTVIDVQGKSVLVTRFVRPLAPPPPYDVQAEGGGGGAEEGVARFVSLIPLLPEVVVFPGQYDIWTTNDQFVEMLVGDQNDHSLLLCNYFLHMKKEAWLLVGVLIPEGACVVVLSRENASSWSVWKAWTGERFSLQDCFCPLVSVGCVFNQHNVWLNVQRSCEPAHLTFDLTNRSRWRPLFHASFPHPTLPSLQPERLEYKETDGQFVERLESRVEEHLKGQLIRWRKRFKTSFNRHCSATLKKLLQKMENSRNGSWSLEEEERSEEETSSQLQTILSAYKMNGFPLSMAYTDLATVSEAVRVKGVHLAEGEEVEFALAVHIHPYPSNVLALWIYVATLVKK